MKPGAAILVAQALDQLAALLCKEMQLARAETEASLRGAAVGAALIAGAGLLVLTVLNLIAAAGVAWMIALGLSEPVAPLAVAACFAALAALMVVLGRNALRASTLMPERTLKNIRKDVEIVKEIF